MNTGTDNTKHICQYGCGREALYQLSNGKWCCESSYNKCPSLKEINRRKAIQRRNDGIYDSDEFRKKISHPSWNKGKILKPKILKPGKCEMCGKEHDGSYGSGRFCSQPCARKSTTIKCDKKMVSKKISESLLKRSDEDKLRSVILGATTYNKNHPEHQIKIPTNLNTIRRYNPQTKTFKIETVKKKQLCKVCGCERINCEYPQLCSYFSKAKISNFEKFGFDSSKIGSFYVYDEIFKFIDLLKFLYIDKKYSIQKIQKEYHLTDWYVISDWLKRFKIGIRSRRDAVNVAISEKRLDISKIHSNQFKFSKHITWYGKEVFLRSSYETDFAKKLDNSKIFYEVETLRIPYFSTLKNKYKISIPDFYIPENDTIYEIKSDFTYTKKDIEDRFKSYIDAGFKNIILVLEHEEFIYPNLPDQRHAKTIDNYWN